MSRILFTGEASGPGGCLLQGVPALGGCACSRGGLLLGGASRPTPKGKFRGIRSRPTPKGEIQGDQIQAHTQGGNSGGSDPGPHPRGKFRGIRTSSPLPMTTAVGSTRPTGMHSCTKIDFTALFLATASER